MHDTLDGVPNALAGYHLEEMEIEVEVSAEGEVSLLGTGGKVGGKGSLTLQLKRTDPANTQGKPHRDKSTRPSAKLFCAHAG